MERKTMREDRTHVSVFGDDGIYSSRDLPHIREAINLLAEYEDTGLTPEDFAAAGQMEHFKEWREWHKADAEKRLVVLPCKVGDTVYRLSAGCCDLREKDCCSAYCDGYDYSCPSYEADTLVEIGHFCLNDLTSLGKTVFLALEDANAARAKEASS